MTRRPIFAIRPGLLVALGGRLKPRADVHLARGRLDRGELRSFGWQKGAAFLAASMRSRSGRAGLRITVSITSSGVPPDSSNSARSAARRAAVLLFGVPFSRPPDVRQGAIRVRPSSLLVSAFCYLGGENPRTAAGPCRSARKTMADDRLLAPSGTLPRSLANSRSLGDSPPARRQWPPPW